tara:strand:- start:232 stop:870 length:639 start_codon:yes stop_codon:yes gene_type:complete
MESLAIVEKSLSKPTISSKSEKVEKIEENVLESLPESLKETSIKPVTETSVQLSEESKEESKEETLTEDKDSSESSEEEDDDDDDDIIYKKLEDIEDHQILLNSHPEMKQLNYNEVLALTKITKNKNGDIIDPLHRTLSVLTKFEKARILGVRAKQLNNGSDALVEIPSDMIDGYNIACKELKEKKIPFIIRRPLPNGSSEYWKVKDLLIFD